MIVYAESNFILELAYLQEEHASCEELLARAEAKQISLLLPAFSVTEARLSLQRRAHRRHKFRDRLGREISELVRSQPYQALSATTEPLTTALIECSEAETARLESVSLRLFAVCQVLPTQGTTLQLAVKCETDYDLSPKDAVILASVLEDLSARGEGKKCFLNRNSRDFANPDIYDELAKYDCKLVSSFKGGLGYVQTAVS